MLNTSLKCFQKQKQNKQKVSTCPVELPQVGRGWWVAPPCQVSQSPKPACPLFPFCGNFKCSTFLSSLSTHWGLSHRQSLPACPPPSFPSQRGHLQSQVKSLMQEAPPFGVFVLRCGAGLGGVGKKGKESEFWWVLGSPGALGVKREV